MIVIDGLLIDEFVECSLNVVIKIGVLDLIKYVCLFDSFMLKVLNLCKK